MTMFSSVPAGSRGFSSSIAFLTPSTTVTVFASASLVTTIVTSWRSPAPAALTASCRTSTPRSDGIESNPHAETIRAPLAAAIGSSSSIALRMNLTSPARSQ